MKDPVVAERGGKYFKVVRGYAEQEPNYVETNPRWLYDWIKGYKMYGFRIVRNR